MFNTVLWIDSRVKGHKPHRRQPDGSLDKDDMLDITTIFLSLFYNNNYT